jgi:hypothetical protein
MKPASFIHIHRNERNEFSAAESSYEDALKISENEQDLKSRLQANVQGHK